MILNPRRRIRGGEWAYSIDANYKVNDMMEMTNGGGGYNRRPISELVIDGWSFACDSRQYEIGSFVDRGAYDELYIKMAPEDVKTEKYSTTPKHITVVFPKVASNVEMKSLLEMISGYIDVESTFTGATIGTPASGEISIIVKPA
jgi:hypothetical protein